MTNVARRVSLRRRWTTGYAAYVASLSPASWWRLGEASGAFVDSIAALNGTAHGTVTYGATGAIVGDSDKAATLDGSTGYITCGDNYDFPTNSAFTVACWVNPANLGAGSVRLVAKDSGANPSWRLWYSNADKIPRFSRVDSGGGTENVLGPTALTTGAWYFVVAKYDGTTLVTYVNAKPGTRTASSRSLGAGNAANLTFGTSNAVNTFLNGSIDEVAIWTRALTDDEIRRLYVIGKGLG